MADASPAMALAAADQRLRSSRDETPYTVAFVARAVMQSRWGGCDPAGAALDAATVHAGRPLIDDASVMIVERRARHTFA